MYRASDGERCITFAHYIIEHRATVRATAAQFGISKSTVHKDVTEALPHINHALYDEVKAILEQNKSERHLRGGEATRRKYLADGGDALSGAREGL
jgi:putative DeoR family transcriptional regulator (stage III sporulation protein D)